MKITFSQFSQGTLEAIRSKFCDWYLDGFYDSYARELSRFRPLPDLATYFSDVNDLVLDISYDIEVQIGHILDQPENVERLPTVLQGNRNLAKHI
ncbi:MAG: DUF3825 domain-containing protein [Acidobacteria bacterium]|nr:DUF3825 domain-containing protein [Acidobacteriota bacterium]